MPRRRKKPAYLLHKATGQARVRLSGKDHDLGEYDSPASRAQNDALIAEWFDRNGDVAVLALTVDDLVLLSMEHAAAHDRKDGQPTSVPSGRVL